MDGLEEFESWHNDLMAWERFQNEIEGIEEEENTSGDLQDIDENDIFLSSRISSQFNAEDDEL